MRRARTEVRIGGAWLDDARLHRLFAAIGRDGDEVFVVGGAVRNALLGVAVHDVDVATTATPDVVTVRARAAGLKPVPTGIDHGTVTVVIEGHPFEVTTLRRDVESHGRHATVAFGRDWSEDAHRRDFTMNALYVGLDGVVHDFVDGIADCLARRVRFIGAAARRIAEDRLRVLRFFRFHAAYGEGALDAPGLAASIAARDELAALSAERIGQEVLKLMVARRAPETLAEMSDVGIAQRIFGRAVDLGGLARVHAIAGLPGSVERGAGDAAIFLAALAGWSEGDVLALVERLRLSNAMRDRMMRVVVAARRLGRGADIDDVDRLLEAEGRAGARDALVIGFARARIEKETAASLLAAAAERTIPVLPLKGGDLVAAGFGRGPEISRILGFLRETWIAGGFRASREELLATAVSQVSGILAKP